MFRQIRNDLYRNRRGGRPLEVYAEDSGLSGADCIALLLAYEGPARASCEIDKGI